MWPLPSKQVNDNQGATVATIRQLPSGNWQALVYVKGERIPFTDNDKAVVEKWASDQEEAKKGGRWRDPRRGRLTLSQWHRMWLEGRIVEGNTEAREESTWRVWVEPQWGTWTLEQLEAGRSKIKAWIKELVKDSDVGTPTIHNIAKLMSKMLTDAVDDDRIDSNPAVRLDVPTAPLKPPFFWRSEEAAAIVEAAELAEESARRPNPNFPYALLIDFDMHVGPRMEELAGLLVDCIDIKLRLAHIVRVAVDGELRDYPKTVKSYRSVPIPPHLVDRFERQIWNQPTDAPVFPARGGGPGSGRYLRDNNFRNRIFSPALRQARMCDCERFDATGAPILCKVPSHAVRWGSPNDMRHTAASWQVMSGVDLYRVQHLLGHEKITTTQRYAHLDPTSHDAVLAAWGEDGLTAKRRRAGRPSPAPIQ